MGLISPFFMFRIFFFIFFFGLTFYLNGQSNSLSSRVEAEYTIKEVSSTGQKNLIIGKVFYDINRAKIVYKQYFPSEQILVFQDSVIFQLTKDSTHQRAALPGIINFSIYHLILTQSISDFGLDKLGYDVVDVKEVGENVVSKWMYKDIQGYILVSQKGLQVDGVHFYDEEGKLVFNQYFKDYDLIGRHEFPLAIYESNHGRSETIKKITTYKNIKIDDFSDEDNYYNIDIDIDPNILWSNQK
ncbi:MAG: hypothetical protein ACJA0X_001553 [Cyclobacteriaceae bacterium]|jgi:hypothetical protein